MSWVPSLPSRSARASASAGITSPTATVPRPQLQRELAPHSGMHQVQVLKCLALPVRQRLQLPMSPGFQFHPAPTTGPTRPAQGAN